MGSFAAFISRDRQDKIAAGKAQKEELKNHTLQDDTLGIAPEDLDQGKPVVPVLNKAREKKSD